MLTRYVQDTEDPVNGKEIQIPLRELLSETALIWKGADSEAKRQYADRIFSLIKQYRIDYYTEKPSLRFLFYNVAYLAMDCYIESGRVEKDGLLQFFIDSDFFSRIIPVFQIKYLETYPLKSVPVLSFFDSIPEDKQAEKILLAFSMFDLLSGRLQRMIKDSALENRESFTDPTIIKAVKSGALPYDDWVYEKLCSWLERTDGEILEKQCPENPVFGLITLYFWGYVDDNELMMYRQFAEKSELISILVHPETYNWEKCRREWNFLLRHPRFIKQREKYFRIHR